MNVLVPVLAGSLMVGSAAATAAPNKPKKADPSQGRANQTIDARTFRIFYAKPGWGDSVTSPVQFEIDITAGFVVARDLACSPATTCYAKEPQFRLDDTGHCHTYVEDLSKPGELAAFDASCERSFEITLPPGYYCAYADLTHNDHVARFKPGPRDLPPFDKVCFTVEPPM